MDYLPLLKNKQVKSPSRFISVLQFLTIVTVLIVGGLN